MALYNKITGTVHSKEVENYTAYDIEYVSEGLEVKK